MDAKASSDQATYLRQSTVTILKAFTRKQKAPEVGFPAFAEYAERYVERYRGQYRQLDAFLPDVRAALAVTLAELARSGQCRLSFADGVVERIDYPLYYVETVREAYRKAEESPEAPFPSEAELGLSIPNELVTTANVGTELTALLQGGEPAAPLVRLLFPESLRSIVAPSEMIHGQLLDLALAKLKCHLGLANNAAYVQSRLAPAYRGNQTLVSDMINNIAMRVGTARQTIEDASDVHFRFWAQLTHVIAQEKKQGVEETLEGGFQQAAHIVNAYAVAMRTAGQSRQNETRAALKAVEAQFGKEPFIYTLKDLLGLKDPGGTPLLTKGSQDAFRDFIKEKMRPPAGKAVPELIRVKAGEGSEYFVHRDRLIPVVLRMIPRAAEATADALSESWERSLRAGRRTPAMSSDAAFAGEVQRVVQADHPVLARLLDSALLNSVQRESPPAPDFALDLAKCFDQRGEKLKPTVQIMELDRRELLARVRAAVPVWMRVGFLRAIVTFFEGLFGRRLEPEDAGHPADAQPGAQKKGAAATAPEGGDQGGTTVKRLVGPSAGGPKGKPVTLKQRGAVYRRSLERLRDHFAGSGKDLALSLVELAEKWNPLYEPKARADLREDVDSMIRSFMRGILRHGAAMKAPDVERIKSLSQQLSANSAFDRIRRKDLFVRYVQLMMIRVLGDQHGIKL